MQTNENPSGSDQNGASGVDDQKQSNANDDASGGSNADDATGGKKDSVAYETYRKVLNEKKSRDQALSEAQRKIEEYEQEQRAREEKELRDKEEFKKLLDIREKELADIKAKLTGIESNVRESRKLDAFLNTLNGTVPREYWGLINIDDIVLNPETNEIDETSVASAVEKFTKSHARLIDRPGQKTGLPNEAPAGNEPLTYQEWLNLPAKDMAKRLKDVIQSPGK